MGGDSGSDGDAETVVSVLESLGLDDGEIAAGAHPPPKDYGEVDGAVDAVRGHAAALYGTESMGGMGGTIAETVLVRSPVGFELDWKVGHGEAEAQLSAALGTRGYDLAFRALDGGPLEGIDARGHPEAFRIAFVDGDDEETVPFRYPPTGKYARWNLHALVEALNRRFLHPRGLELAELVAALGDHYRFVLADRETLDRLEDQFGENVPLYGDYLVDRGPYLAQALDGYDPSSELDHREEFGTPEPEGTFRVEALPDARAHLD